ncbi:MAG: L-rhamnose mutarotase [Natronospirillum sp.]
MKTFVQLLDLKDDPDLIAEYKRHHQAVWPEVTQSLRGVGVIDMKIFSFGNRLVMLLTTEEGYQPEEAFQQYLNSDPACIEWERKMDHFQQAVPGAKVGQKWVPMDCCFDLSDCQ